MDTVSISDPAKTTRRFYVAESTTTREYAHSHTSLALTYVVHGKCLHNVNGNQSIISDGDFFIIDLGSWHSCKVQSNEIELINIVFTPGLFSASLNDDSDLGALLASDWFLLSDSQPKKEIADRIFHDTDLEIFRFFSQALSEYDKGDICWKTSVKCCVSGILTGMMRKAALPENVYNKSDVIHNCKIYISEHYSEALSLTNICHRFGYSVSYISSKFRESTGMTFSQYLQRERISRSRALLLCTNLPIETICEKVGYHNSTFFYRIFKNEVGMSPKEYRYSHEKAPSEI